MRQNRSKPIIIIACLIAITGAAMAYSSKGKSLLPNLIPPLSHHNASPSDIVSVSGHLIQNRVLQGSPGTVGFSMTLQAADTMDLDAGKAHNVDMVIVVDRSGSMKGQKLEDARQAVLQLLSGLSDRDRFALVSYSDSVQQNAVLQYVTDSNRENLYAAVLGIRAGGGTNLGAGLQMGINLLSGVRQNGNAGKVILISDGLANKGITDSYALGKIASVAVEKEFAVSTVGVGIDFNENLMTHIADHGSGHYYYLENPDAFAEVFQKEFYYTKAAAATGLVVAIPLEKGMSLVDAAGYPIKIENGNALFYPGDLRSGQSRKLFLTFKVPTIKEENFRIEKISVRYRHDGQLFSTTIDESFQLACVKDQREVFSSIDKSAWTEKVLKEDYNRLKQEVAADIKAGKKEEAMQRIQQYHKEQESINTAVGSAEVSQNLERDLDELRTVVKDTFQGAPAAVERKQKSNAKFLQYDGYNGRRMK